MKGNLKYIISLFVFCVILVFPQKSQASNSDLIINEIYPNPNVGENEWVEIYNPTGGDIDLANYSLEDGTHKPKILFGILVSGGYFVIEKISGGFTFALNNDKEIVILRNSNEIIDQVAYGDWDDGTNNPDNNAVAPNQGKALSRIPNGEDSDIDKLDFKILLPSKGVENFLPVYSNKIRINETVPQPASGSKYEFIELYNSGDEDVDLFGWQIDDIDGGSKPYTIQEGVTIGSKKYLTFYNATTKISLNDSGDSVRLVDPNGDVKSDIDYNKARRGQSYSLFLDGWKWTIKSTPGSKNIYQEEVILPDEDIFIPETTIESARELLVGEVVKIAGVVSVLPGKLSSQYFYIQNDDAGIQVYSYYKLFPSLRLGDFVQVTGEIAEYKNEKRIKIASDSDIQIVSSRSPPEPKVVKINELSENLEGQYIKVAGTVTKTSGNVFYIHGSGEIQVSIREGTGIKKPKMRVGDKVEITGILSQYGSYYRILPTRQDDVKIIKSSMLAKSGNGLEIVLAFSAVITILILFLWNTYQKVRKKRPELLGRL
jgi:DNA/RNA endonuclease YhcR with UshA esterase domain